MKIYKGINSLVKNIDGIKRQDKTIGFVPTMGYLHEGHLSLIRRARKDADIVAVSIFVNPAQFGPEEDFKKYPRDMKRDMSLCRAGGVDMVFVPDARSLYPRTFSTYVNVEGLTDGLCGSFRPGHFKGVTTVVTKLFNIVRPDIAYFGQKDAQQAMVIKRMVQDLNIPVKIKVMPIVREKDGLAMSSRNAYLRPEERRKALLLSKSLGLASDLCKKGERDPKKIMGVMEDMICRNKSARIDYISIVDMDDLKPVKRISGKALVALAVNIGKTRLIDNITIGR